MEGHAMTVSIGFTYEVITPESAEQGDASERGWYGPGGYFYSDGGPDAWKPGALKAAIQSARSLGISEPSQYPEIQTPHAWFSSVDPDQDYSSGEATYYSLHVDGASVSTLRRIARVLSGRCVFGK
jgi:hypothetical protein